jgi:CTP:molybdopterin cytidylyltransferase MocA
LLAIGDQEGAKEVIRCANCPVVVPFDHAALFDLDTPEDLARLALRAQNLNTTVEHVPKARQCIL